MRLAGLLEREVDPRPLAIVRIIVGLSALGLAVLVERSAVQGITSPDVFHAPAFSWLPQPTTALIDAILILWIAFAIALTVGFFARPAALGVAAVAAAAMTLDLQAFSNHLTLLIALSALLALGNPSAAWSLDARRHPSATATIPYWPVFLVKFQISTLYGYAALTKINGSFLGAEVGSDVFVSPWRQTLNEVVAPLGDLIFVGAAVSTVLVEGFLAVALWSSRLRRIALPLGLAFHGTIVLALGFGPLIFFGAMVVGTYVLFPEWRPASRLVIWDERCVSCARFIRLFGRLDWFGVHDFVGLSESDALARPGVKGARVDEAIQLVGARERSEGFDAVRMMFEKSPVTFLVAPLLGVWPLAALGRRAYRRAASRRTEQIESVRA